MSGTHRFSRRFATCTTRRACVRGSAWQAHCFGGRRARNSKRGRPMPDIRNTSTHGRFATRAFVAASAALLAVGIVRAQTSGPATPSPSAPPPATSANATAVPGAQLKLNFAPNDPPGEWHSQARDYANTRYSPLDQVTSKNVSELKVAWTFSDGTLHGHEAAPLVLDNTMYLVT